MQTVFASDSALPALLKSLSPAPAIHRLTLRPHAMVQAGRSRGALVVITEGLAARSMIAMDGRAQISCFYGPGDAVNLEDILFDQSDATVVRAVSPCAVSVFEIGEHRCLLDAEPRLRQAVLGQLMARRERSVARIAQLGMLNAEEALAALMVELSSLLPGTEIHGVPLTLKLIGEAIGITEVHAGRIMRRMADEGILRKSAGRVFIEDYDMLRDRAAPALARFVHSVRHEARVH